MTDGNYPHPDLRLTPEARNLLLNTEYESAAKKRLVAQLIARIDDLVAALRVARELIDDYAEEYGHGTFSLVRDKIDAALAKAES